MADLGTARGRIIIDSSGVARGVGQANASVVGLGKTLARTAGLAGAGVGLAAGLRSIVTTAMDFEQAMSRLQAVSDGTARQFAALRQQAITMGAQTAYSATQAAQAQTELAKAGVGLNDILNGGLQGALALAAAGELDLGQAAAIAANAMKQFGLSGRDVTGIADALATAANQTTADVGDFGLALAQSSSAAKQSGLGFRDTLSALEALADQGVKGSDAGTSLKAALLSLISPTDQAAAAMKTHGLAVTDTNGKMVGTIELSRRLTAATEGMTRAQRTQFLATLAGRDGFRALAALIDAGPAGMRRYQQGLAETGTAAETARKKQDNLRGDLEQLSGAFETLQIKVGSKLLGGLRTVTQEVAGLVDAVSRSKDLDGFFNGLTTGATTASGVLPTVGVALHDIAVGAAGLASSGLGAAAALAPLANGLVAVAGAGVGATSGLVGFLGGVLQTSAGQAALTGALYAGVGAWAAYKVATIGAAAATRAVAVGQAVAAFAGLAAQVRSAQSAVALLGAAFPALANPVVATIAGIAAFVGLVGVLKSGMFSGGSAAQEYASAMDRVRSSTDAASGAIQRASDAINGFKRSKLDAVQATLAVERAERSYQQAVAQNGRSSLEAREALANLTQAKQRSAEANQAAATSSRDLVANLAKEAQAVAENRGAIEKAMTLKGRELAINRQWVSGSEEGRRTINRLSKEYGNLVQAYRGNGVQLDQFRGKLKQAAAAMDASTPAARRTKAALEALATADADGLARFVADIKTGTDAGQSQAQATSNAIRQFLAQSGNAPVDMSGFIASIAAGGAAAIATARNIANAVRAELKSAGPNVRKSPSANDLMKKGLEDTTLIIRTGMQAGAHEAERGAAKIRRATATMGQVTTRLASGQYGAAIAGLLAIGTRDATALIDREVQATKGGADQIATIRTNLEKQLARLRRQAENERLAAQARDLVESRTQASRELSKAQRAIGQADKPDEEKRAREQAARARHALAQARRDLASFLTDTRRQARDTQLQTAIDARDRQLQAAEKAAQEAEKARQDHAQAIADLESTIQSGRQTIDSGLQQISSAIVDSLQRALKAQMEAFDRQFKEAEQAARESWQQTIDAIAASDDTRRLGVVNQELDAARQLKELRQQRNTQRERASLTDEAATQKQRVQALQRVLDQARTESERQAAKTLLDAAIKDASQAADALAAFEEDQNLDRLEREKQGLEAVLAARREAADKALDDARRAAQEQLDVQRETAQQAMEQQVADLQRNLGDLREQYQAGEIDAATFLGRLAATYQAFTPELEASGRELGLSFSRGLARSITDVQGAATMVAQAVADRLRLNSPAKTGPLSFDFRRSGLALTGDLADGLAAGAALVVREAERIAAAAAAAQAASPAAAATPSMAGAATPGGTRIDQITIQASAPFDPRMVAENLGWHLAHVRGN